MGIRAIDNHRINSLALRPLEPSKVVGLRKNIIKLWPDFTSHIFEEVTVRGKCTIIADGSKSYAQLFLKEAGGQMRGPYSDPLKLSQRMLSRNIGQIEIKDRPGIASSIDKVLLAFLSDGFQPYLGTGLCRLGDYFIDQADNGLPILSGINYSPLKPGQTFSTKGYISSSDAFYRIVDREGSADRIIQILQSQVVPYYPKDELMPFIKILMVKAKWFYMVRHDIEATNALRAAVFSLDYSPEQNRSVIKIMMEHANMLTDSTGPESERDVVSAIHSWKTVYGFGLEDENKRILRTMMDIANIFSTDPLIKNRINIFISAKIWLALYSLAPPDDQQRVIFTIMNVANKNKYFALQIIDILSKEDLDPYFKARALAELYYHADDFPSVINQVDTCRRTEPDIIIQKAEALRKLWRHPEAISLSTEIISQYVGRKSRTLQQSRGLVNAFCCRGYSYLEMAKNGDSPESFDSALTDFQTSIIIAEADHSIIPPRAYDGLGYIYERTGKNELAREAFEQALKIDKDNEKAIFEID